MSLGWNTKLLEAVIAPAFGSFTHAVIPDLRAGFPEAEHWLKNHFLNSALSGRYQDGFRQLALGFIRRGFHGFRAFHEARELTLAYLDGVVPSNPRVQMYYDAIDAWETCALQYSMALDLYRRLSGGKGAFSKGDQSPASRLYAMANQIKHTGSCVESGQCVPTDTVPLWLTNDGLASFAGTTVTYSEAAQLIAEIAELANEMQDPSGFVSARGKEGSGGR